MRALYFTGPGGLEWREADEPRLQGDGEALVRPLAVAACDLDLGIVGGEAPFAPPFQLGHEFAGEIVALGDAVTGLAVGDRVAVSFEPSCGRCGPCRRGHSAACDAAAGTAMYGIGPAGGDWGGAFSELVRVPFAEAMLTPLPAGMEPATAAGASDNIADGYRTVADALRERPQAPVLVAGEGSIALYAAWWARTLGASTVTFASRSEPLLARAAAFGVTGELVDAWPRRFRSHPITVDCTGDAAGLGAVLRSTAAYGRCTSASIYFGGDTPVPMFDMYMKGIRFDTGRVNAVALLPEVLALMAHHQLEPATVGATVTHWDAIAEALLEGAFKPIAVRG